MGQEPWWLVGLILCRNALLAEVESLSIELANRLPEEEQAAPTNHVVCINLQALQHAPLINLGSGISLSARWTGSFLVAMHMVLPLSFDSQGIYVRQPITYERL